MRQFGASLGEGNTKVGEVFNFSLPSTCPGADTCWVLGYLFRPSMNFRAIHVAFLTNR